MRALVLLATPLLFFACHPAPPPGTPASDASQHPVAVAPAVTPPNSPTEKPPAEAPVAVTPPTEATSATTPPAEPKTPPKMPVDPARTQGSSCGEGGACAVGLRCIEYYGVAGARGPKLGSCEIPCASKTAKCPRGQQCVTISDGPGRVCRP